MKILHLLVLHVKNLNKAYYVVLHACMSQLQCNIGFNQRRMQKMHLPPHGNTQIRVGAIELCKCFKEGQLFILKSNTSGGCHINLKLNCLSFSRKSSPGYDLHQAMMGSWNIILLEWKCLESFKLKLCIMYQSGWIKMGDLNTK